MNPLVAVAGAAFAAAAGARLGWLTRGGAVAACLIGGGVLLGGGLHAGVLLGLFFVSGSLLTKWSEGAVVPADGPDPSRRNGVQVVANGLWAALGALAIPAFPPLGWAVLAGALGAAQADTWATEIGARSRRPTRLISTGAVVPPGTSGGVTPLGTSGGVAGAGLMAAVALAGRAPVPAALSALLGGSLGLILDSWLGATVQGDSAAVKAGWAWCTNDVVNLAGSGTGALVGLGLGLLWMAG